METLCSVQADAVFGPAVMSSCRDGFDFTLLFEQTLLDILPAVGFIFAFPSRFWCLAKSNTKTLVVPARFQKLAVAVVLLALQLTLLILWSVAERGRTRATLPSTILNLVVSLLLLGLSWMEDARSVRPSWLLNTYLLLTILLDLPQARTLWLQRTSTTIASTFTSRIGVKVVLLILEVREKRPYLKQPYKDLPPESTSGIINRSFLWWIVGLLRRGLSSQLTFEDLYVLDGDLASTALSAKMRHAWDHRRRPEHRFEFPWAACKALWRPFLLAAFPRVCLIGFTFAQPFLISRVLHLLAQSDPDSREAANDGYGLIGATALIYLGLAVSTLHYNQALYRFLTMFRGATVALVYEHMLVLPVGVYDESAALTLMGTDVDRIVLCIANLNECWARVIEVAVGIALLAMQLGWICVMPVIVVIISFIGSTQISKTIGGRQKVWVDAVQKRITLTASILSGMRSIKMMGLTTVLSSMVQEERVEETHRMAGFRWSLVWQNVVQNLPWALSPALTFTIYVAQAMAQGKSSIGTTQAFTSLSIITLLSNPAAKLLSAIPSTAASLGCFDRVQKFLIVPPRAEPRIVASRRSASSPRGVGEEVVDDVEMVQLGRSGVNDKMSSQVAIVVDRIDIRPTPSAELALRDVSFNIPRGSLTMVIGPVGSGKTTLLRAILGEAAYGEGGSVSVASERIGFCAQTPWLPNMTIRQAILGLSEEGRLDMDEGWYETCLHACALVHDMDLIPEADQTQIGSASTVLSGGQKQRVSLARCLYSRVPILLLDDVLAALDAKTQATVMARLFGEGGLLRKQNTTTVLVTHAIERLRYADKILLVSDGHVQDCGTYHEAVSRKLIESLNFAADDASHSESGLQRPDMKGKSAQISKANQLDDLRRATGDMEVYRYYFRSIGWPQGTLFVSFVIMNVFCSSFSGIWLKWWTDIGGGQIELYMSIYLTLGILTSIGQGGYVWAILVLISPSTARKFHSVLLKVVMRAPQSFFATDSGSILNRFSQDMTLIEGQLATGVLVTVSNLFMSLASAALIATGSAYMATTVPLLLLAVWALQRIYLRTSRQLRLLDLEARSPLYSLFLETLSGLVTVRAFGWEGRLRAESCRRLDYSQRPYYLLYCIQRWLALVLDLIVGAEAVLVVGLAVGLRRETSAGLVGVSLNNILSFSAALSSLVTGWTMLETSLGSIARLKDFEAIVKPEDMSGETHKPPPNWPDCGEIQFHNVTAAHSPGAVGIRGVTLHIKPGQKVGICGRTGSGKSSLISTLLRLLELESGKIHIDNLDLSTLPRSEIRSRLFTIPQDPLILAGRTLRLNLDPHARQRDSALVSALERVGLGTLLSAKGLDAELADDVLSKGQQQLLALARLLLKKQSGEGGGKILLLDEATSNVDRETDRVLQRVIGEEFRGWTVLAVAHRVGTVVDADVVVVMEGGRVVEVGMPEELMRKEGGWFAGLLKASGRGE